MVRSTVSVPELRIRALNQRNAAESGSYVLYWMVAYRRGQSNFALQRAVEWAIRLGKPLLVFEPLRVDYPWASDRLHAFIMEGMVDNAECFRRHKVTYFPYVERERGEGRGLLAALARDACVVVSDDFPCFFLPRMQAAAAGRMPVLTELVDSNGILPMRAAPKIFARAFDFRRYLQQNLRPYLEPDQLPLSNPLSSVELPAPAAIPEEARQGWPAADVDQLTSLLQQLGDLPIDHNVPRVEFAGGSRAGAEVLNVFVQERLGQYMDYRNDPSRNVTSGLSPYLHFGHVSAHDVFRTVTEACQWHTGLLAEKANGSAQGWWGSAADMESFLDELITWRELGYNMCWQTDNYDQYQSLPQWARSTLHDHASDPRPSVYELEQFERSETHNDLWNATQRQLVLEGRIHSYLRMLWGKKILEWSPSPESALETMIELNNKYAVDGRDPNSYSGIFWVLGRYDRPWGPERPIFGKIRYMSSKNTARKVDVKGYLARFSTNGDLAATEPQKRG